MATYYTSRALEKLREDGVLALVSSAIRLNSMRVYRRVRIRKNQFLANVRYDAVADPYKIVNISSSRISKYLKTYPGVGKWDHWGGVENGEWDRMDTIPIEETPHYQAFTEHFCRGTPWEKTCIIDHKANYVIENLQLPYEGCETRDELREHYIEYHKKHYNDLYRDINEHGFQAVPRENSGVREYDVPEMVIGRGGDFIFRGNGHNRVAIAKVLELDEIPVYIYMRHSQWQEIRDDIYNNGLSEKYEELHDHPDLQDILN